jgi:hypothetical protein
MQVAGTLCQTCNEKIFTSGDGTWCPHCSVSYHTECIHPGSPCTQCGQPWTPPDQKFHYSALCPLCGRHNDPPAKNCAHCGTVTHWDDERAYVTRRSQVQAWGGKQTVFGTSMIVGSVTLALVLFGVPTVALAFFLIPAGVMKVRSGLRARRFH